MAAAPPMTVNAAELRELCLLDSDLYCRTFFPRTFRQSTPPFHLDCWDVLEDRAHRHVALEVFRGGGKTTTLRAYTSKRIAYGISRTILFISESQDHAQKSTNWIRRQVEHNALWRDVFMLAKGAKWSDEIVEIEHGLLGHTITLIPKGITGQTRGINIDDWRPDLIVVDDPCDEENTATPEQREKITALFFGALEKSLAPASESPDAKMVLLQTSLDSEDLINSCHRDPQWASRKYPCFNDKGQSVWPERFPTDTLLMDKEAHIARGLLRLWLREMECQALKSDLVHFKSEWLKYWDVLPEGMVYFLGLDPVPPPSERELATGLKLKDFETLAVIGLSAVGDFYLVDIAASKGHTPEWTATEFFRLLDKWRFLRARVEAIAYQRTLKWLLEQEMRRKGRYVQINSPSDKRKKSHRIVQALSGIASAGRFFVHRSHTDFCSQFVSYPNTKHDDLLDAVAMAVDEASGLVVEIEGEGSWLEQPDLPQDWRDVP